VNLEQVGRSGAAKRIAAGDDYGIARAQQRSGRRDRIIRSSMAHVLQTWLFLDPLDEVRNIEALPRIFAALEKWQSKVVIASRPYGYTATRSLSDTHGRTFLLLVVDRAAPHQEV
jgi:hypothetical protein